MKYLLDTNTCIYIIKKKPGETLMRLRQSNVSDIGISSITLSELEYGVEKSERKEQNRLALVEFLLPFEIVFYDDSAAYEYGMVRSYLERIGEPIGSLDMLIAAHAFSLDATLVTNNEREFRRIPDLKIVNWVS